MITKNPKNWETYFFNFFLADRFIPLFICIFNSYKIFVIIGAKSHMHRIKKLHNTSVGT